MVLTNKDDTYVFTKRIEFKIKDSDEVDYVELREFNMQEMKQFQIAAKYTEGEMSDPIGAIAKAEEFFAGCVVNSSFTDENGNPCSGKVIYDYLKRSSSLFQMILSNWLRGDDNPFQLVNQTKTN